MSTPFRLASQKLEAFLAVSDAGRAKAFYGDMLGLPLVSEELPFALVFDLNGVMLRVTLVKDLTPPRFTVLGWRVPNIGVAVKALSEASVCFERYQGMPQDELGIWTSPTGAKVAWFKDPDGNTLSLTQ